VVLQAAIAKPKKASIVCNVLESFIAHVSKYASNDPTQANELIADARRIQAVIGCR
jgi:hypothetical protein